jgi:hypothetical protein
MRNFFYKKIKSISSLFLKLVLLITLTHCTAGTNQQATISFTRNPSSTSNPSPSPTLPTPTPTPTPSTKTLIVSWNSNKESAVNSSGGGYKVYYSTTPDFDLNNASLVNVPYVSGNSAPTQVEITNLARGNTYYIKVIAYSSITSPMTSTNSTSTPSTEVSIAIP